MRNPPSDQNLNAFARGLVSRFVESAVGSDERSVRLVDERPSDRIIAGFLTASPRGAAGEGGEDEALATDLPRDEAYQQTSLGLQWLVPRTAFRPGVRLSISVELSVYVRRLPSRDDQSRFATWTAPRRATEEARTTGQPVVRVAEAVPVWTREDLGVISVPVIDLDDLLRRSILTRPLAEAVSAALQTRSATDLYPGRAPLILTQPDAETDEAFAVWRASIGTGSWPLGWRPYVDVRLSPVPTEPELLRVTARVVNGTPAVARQSQEFVDANLYCVKLRAFVPREAHRPTVFRELPQSFRYDRRMSAVGINANACAREEGGAVVIETESVPSFTAPRLEPRTIRGALPTFAALAQDPVPILQEILQAMRSYDSQQWNDAVGRQQGELERNDAEEARATFRQEIERYARGVELLVDRSYPHVLRAFQLMNRSMNAAARGAYAEWRLFQLVFIVSQLPVLAAREYEALARQDDETVDILWFAAGGGKTEAFLGLIIWQAFFDRLRGKEVGVAAFVRFPLRLLTFQQLQRLGAALAAADEVRRAERLPGNKFSIGYFVGQATTPNEIDEETHARFSRQGVDEKLLRVYRCPYCNSPTRLNYDASQKLVEHRCTNAETGCPNGTTRLPIYVVDADLYRFLPTVVVSTVDKLAQLGQNQRFSQLLGRFSVVCPIHGASFLGANKTRCSVAGDLDRGERPSHCGTRALRYGPFHDPSPSLLIQDELHLLTEELGTFDAHYESAVAELFRSLGSRPWKVIGATATIERYEDHAWHLYLRRARQFPGPGPQAYDSFYYTQSTGRIGRIFVGLVGVGRKHTPSVSKALTLLYLELQIARELCSNDLPAACRRYGVAPIDRVEFEALVFLYELVLTYVLTRKGSDQVSEAIESRVKKEIQESAPAHGDLIVETFNGGVSEAEMSAAVQRIRDASPSSSPAERPRGIVATNVIGHGVDVNRFNIIVFAGFPRLVAEYIQASARVGRLFPGISVFVATPQSERDRSIFDRFAKFHEYVDRLVDPSAINRWPVPAMQRTVPGVLGGYLMGVAAAQVGRRLATVEDVQAAHIRGDPPVLMRQVEQWAERAYGVDRAPSARYADALRLTIQNRYSTIINRPRVRGGRPEALNIYLGPMRSLRDTDDPASINLLPSDAPILRRLTRG